MKIKLFLTLLALSFISCSPLAKYYGKYYCKNNTTAINYLVINSDKTYFHYYKKDSITLSQSGKWGYKDDRFERIELFNFNNYNEQGENYKTLGNYILIKDNRYLSNGFDGNTYSSFIKE